MLDGLVKEGNVLPPDDVRVVEVKKRSLKKYYVTILFSILVHIILALALFFISDKRVIKPVKIEHKAIKSYLYKMPVKVKAIPKEIAIKKVQPIEKPIKEKLVAVKQEINQQTISKKAIIPKKANKNITKPKTVAQKEQVTALVSTPVKDKVESKKSVKASFSAYKQLNSLRSSINEKIIAEELSQRQQFRSPSMMHGEPASVPHSNKPLTLEQERKKNTNQLSNDIAITNHNNGFCTIEREQFLGSPIEGSSSVFACGESKFDKSFREHMEKVRAKIMPVKAKNNK